MANSSNLDLAINALVLIRNAQRAIDSALRMPPDQRAEVAGQIEAVRESVGKVAASLTTSIPGAHALAEAGQAVGGGLAQRPELRVLGEMVSFFARQGSEALGVVAGVAGSMGGGQDRSLVLSERISERLTEVGVATRDDLARELGVDARAPDFQDALERTLGSGRAEWYGRGTFGLPRDQLEAMIARARDARASEPAEPAAPAAAGEPEGEDAAQLAAEPALGEAVEELNASLDELRGAISAGEPEDLPPAS